MNRNLLVPYGLKFNPFCAQIPVPLSSGCSFPIKHRPPLSRPAS